MESVLLLGEGGVGSLALGNRQSGSSEIPLIFELNEQQSKLCSSKYAIHSNGASHTALAALDTHGNPKLQKTVTIFNTGNLRTTIYNVAFGNTVCSGNGFQADRCRTIEIEANEQYDLKIL